jgi:hypothetical protein
MANFIEQLFNRKNGSEQKEMQPTSGQFTIIGEVEKGNMNQLGYIKAGRNNADPSALRSSFELIKSGHIVEESNNEQKINEIRESIDKAINENSLIIQGHKASIEKIDKIELPALDREIELNRQKIEQIRFNAHNFKYERNRFNTILTWIGFIAGFIYLYFFYVSAIHSALFRNIASEVANANMDNIGLLLNNVFNVAAYKEFNIHWLAPVIFFIFAVILHFTLEMRSKLFKIPAIVVVVFFVMVADGLLAYAIENNNHKISKLMGLSDGSWTFYKSFVFYLVLFFGFFTSMGWSLILHRLAKDFESVNPERKAEEEIKDTDKVLKQLYYEKGNIGNARIENSNAINSLEEKNKAMEVKKSNIYYSAIDLEKNIDDFYNGWLLYLNGLKSEVIKKQECDQIYIDFKSANFSQSLTA